MTTNTCGVGVGLGVKSLEASVTNTSAMARTASLTFLGVFLLLLWRPVNAEHQQGYGEVGSCQETSALSCLISVPTGASVGSTGFASEPAVRR